TDALGGVGQDRPPAGIHPVPRDAPADRPRGDLECDVTPPSWNVAWRPEKRNSWLACRKLPGPQARAPCETLLASANSFGAAGSRIRMIFAPACLPGFRSTASL